MFILNKKLATIGNRHGIRINVKKQQQIRRCRSRGPCPSPPLPLSPTEWPERSANDHWAPLDSRY